MQTHPALDREGSPPSLRRVVTTRCNRLWVDAEGMLRIESLPGIVHTLADVEETVAVGWRLGKPRRLRILVDARRLKGMERAARVFMAGRVPRAHGLATSILIDSPLSRVVGNVFLSVNEPQLPARLFTGEDEALAWLRTFAE